MPTLNGWDEATSGKDEEMTPQALEDIRIAMIRKKISSVVLAKALDLSESSFSRKLNGKVDFWVGEARILSEILEISNPTEIFFSK